MSTASASPLKAAKSSRAGLGCVIPFGLLFGAIGLAAFWFVSLRPILRAIDSAGWIETPCEILSSELEHHSGSDSTTYRVAIRYRYPWPPSGPAVEQGGSGAHEPPSLAASGRGFRESDRYDFTSGSTNVGVARMRAAVGEHPPGRRTVCYVDPDDPDSAVLNRGIPSVVWFGSFTLLFPLFGGLVILFAWKGARKARADARSPLASATASPALPDAFHASNATPRDTDRVSAGETVLKPSSGRVGVFIGLTFFALFWNGIVGVFVFQAAKEFGHGFIGWFLPIFLIPFVLVGLLVLGAAFQAFSRLFAPPVEVRLDPSLLHLGARVPFTWRLGGRGVRKLTVRLVAREEATYRQGTNTRTDRSDFHRAVVFESSDVLALAEGRAELVLPTEAVAPAFASKNNKLVWELVFDGEIPWRADVDDRFPLPVQGPEAPESAESAPEPRAYEGQGHTLWTVDRFAPGDTLVLNLASGGSPPAGPITVRLGWFTEGRGTGDAEIVWSKELPAFPPGVDRSVETLLPRAPWSFSGKLVSVSWRLEVLDSKGEPLISAPLVIAPRGEIVTLPELPKEKSVGKWRFGVGS